MTEKETINLKWHEDLVKDCKTIIDETRFTAGVTFLWGKWRLGDRIVKDLDKFGKRRYGDYTQEMIAKDLEISQGHVSALINFREKVGDSFDNWMKKNNDICHLSWRKIIREWMAKPKEEKIKVSLEDILRESLSKCTKEQIKVLVDRAEAANKIYRDLGKLIPLKELGLNIAKLEAIAQLLTYVLNTKEGK